MIETVKQVCKDMFKQRGYTNIYENNNDSIYLKANNGKLKVCLYFSGNKTFDIEKLKETVKKVYDINYNHVIIVYGNKITSHVKNILLSSSFDIQIEIFNINNLKYNPTKHFLTPLHKKVEDKKLKETLAKYGNNLSSIPIDDPISRFYNFKKGDIIDIDNGITYCIVK